MDDALENLESETASLKEVMESVRQDKRLIEERLQIVERENEELRKILDEVTAI